MSSVHLNSVIRLLQRKGNDDYSLITITETVSASDPTDVTISESSDAIHSYEGRYKNNEIDGTTIKMGDIKLYCDPSTCASEPSTADKIKDASGNYFSVMSVHRWKEQDTVVLYILQLRK